ncbi:MAG: hypothetical protein WAU91_14155, partial [Desulfatitalea sp.]
MQQGKTIGRLQGDLDAAQRQAALLKDEKDVLHAKLVMYEIQKKPETAQKISTQANMQTTQKPKAQESSTPLAQNAAPQAVAVAPTPAPEIKPAEETSPSPPSVNWVMDLQKFEVKYDAGRELLKIEIRVVNNSVHKKSFAGRMVVVLKQADDPPVKWIATPSVPFADGKPSGKNGQAFSVQNYRTMDFKVYKQRAPIVYDTASVFIFLTNGELLLTRDFHFKIEVKPTPEPKAEVAPTPQAGPATTPAPSPVTPPATPPAAIGQPTDTVAPAGGQGPVSPAPTDTEGLKMDIDPAESMLPKQEQPQPTGTPNISTPAGSPVTIPEKSSEAAQPGEDAQPKSQGER